jgi:GNAT superfamily N-acetyltransferase
MDNYKFTTDKAELDIDAIHAYLNRSYWATGMPIALLEKAIQHSLCFGVLTSNGDQIGFARVISDRATFAYLSDVYILEEHRGKGLSKQLIAEIMKHPELQGLRRINLATQDAHTLYQKFGFTALAHPERMMEIVNADVYKQTHQAID